MLKLLFVLLMLASAANAQNVSVNLTWSPSTDNVKVTGYNVYRNGVKIGTSTTTSYTDATANATTQYDYTVSAIDAVGNESGKSIAATVKPKPPPDTTPPSVPTNLVATPVSDTIPPSIPTAMKAVNL